MRRVPVVATVRDSYIFTATHLGGIIGLIWVPMLLLTVMGFFSFQRYYNDFIEAMAGSNPAALGPSLLMMLGYLVAALLLHAVMYVAVIQLALGTRTAPAIAHFAFGPLEWRMFRAFLAFVGVMLAFLIPAVVVGNAAQMAAPVRVPMLGPMLLLAAIYGAVLLAMPRFMALLPAIAVNETVPVLRRSWQLSAGNFWRLLAVLLAIFLPVLALFAVLEAALTGSAPSAVAGTDQMQLMAGIMRARETLPLLSGLGFLVSPLVVGLFAGASVSAWRALSEDARTDITA
ncbi:MAG: hypothetical protein JWR38_5894 [Mucilaginibacter sp.]|nr:hypothetical protein [Mucilaginibacter sp.]